MILQGVHIRCLRGRIQQIDSFDGAVRITTESGTRDYPNCSVLPGFVDSHAHVIGLGMKLSGLSLYDCTSAEECVARAVSSGPNRAEWVVGMGWNQELWTVAQMPDRSLLDTHFPATPVCLRRADGHSLWLNSTALERAGIHEDSVDPVGGHYLRRSDGSLTGVVLDTAMEAVLHVLPEYTNDQYADFIRTALAACAAQGITEIHDMDVAPQHVALYRELAEKGELKCRLQTWVKAQLGEWRSAGLLPAVGEFQQTVGVKFYADGALGSRGAALFEDYADDAGNKGLLLISPDALYSEASLAINEGFHVATHAIGDAANALVLGVYERLRRDGVADEQTILRIEHSQIVRQQDQPRFAAASIIASVQPVHCISDAPMAEKRLADRCEYAYPWASLQEANAKMCAGSDFPIESHSVIVGIDAFCRRIPFHATQSWYGNECLTRLSALKAYTIDAHVAADMQYRRGELRPGFDADFVIVDQDLLNCDAERILDTRIIATYCGAKLSYEA